jgi:UPF0755 protein
MARICIPAIVVLTFLAWLACYPVLPGPGPAGGDEVRVAIPPGQGFAGVYRALVAAGVVEEDVRFGLLASWRGVSKRLQAGEYLFRRPTTPSQVLHILVKGSTLLHPLTFQEGLTMQQVTEELSRRGWGAQPELLTLCHDPDFIAELGVQAPSLEGYLFPDTYYLSRSQSGRAVLRMMVQRFFAVHAALQPPSAGGTAAMGLHELVILASIVEKETGLDQERPQIARVFLNRLQKNMRLQADPTVIYGLADFDGNLTRRHLRESSPFNTYVIKGLPLGPIANPGRDSLQAVLQPAEGDWLYFVARGDGSHVFSSNLKDHNRAVRKYQKKQ